MGDLSDRELERSFREKISGKFFAVFFVKKIQITPKI